MSKKNLRTGFTTGTCAAAAAKAAVICLLDGTILESVELALADGKKKVSLPVKNISLDEQGATASIVKDSGDDPDATNGMTILSSLIPVDSKEIIFKAGNGVGVITKKGLSIPVGEPAINPVPREMIKNAISDVTDKKFEVTVSIPNGEKVAQKTFNPRLGIEGGLSVLGTTGIVRPYSHPAIQESLKCTLDVAIASGINSPVFTAGNIGTRSAKALGISKEKIIEVGNEWGFMLDALLKHDIVNLLAVGHPGKLAKLIANDWDTHSSRSKSALPTVSSIYKELFGNEPEDNTTVEGLFADMDKDEAERLGFELTVRIACAITEKTKNRFAVTVVLVRMNEELMGKSGGIEL